MTSVSITNFRRWLVKLSHVSDAFPKQKGLLALSITMRRLPTLLGNNLVWSGETWTVMLRLLELVADVAEAVHCKSALNVLILR